VTLFFCLNAVPHWLVIIYHLQAVFDLLKNCKTILRGESQKGEKAAMKLSYIHLRLKNNLPP